MQQNSTTIRTGMFNEPLNYFTYFSKLGASDMHQSIDKISKAIETLSSFLVITFFFVLSTPLILH